jgi:hypothetical protein
LPTRACRGFPGVAFASVDFVARSPRGSAARGIPASRTALLHQVPLRPRRTSIVRAAPGSTRESFDRTSRRPTSLRRDPVLAEPRSHPEEIAPGAARHDFRRSTTGADSGSAVASPSELSRRATCPGARAPRLPRQDLSERLRPPPIRRGVQGLVPHTAAPPWRPEARRAHRRPAMASRGSSRTPPIRQSPARCGGSARPNHNWRESGQKRA